MRHSLCLAGVLTLTLAATAQQPSPPARARFVDSYSGVPIICEVDEDMFPSDWRTRQIDALASPLHPSLVSRSVRLTQQALRKYPAAIVKRNLLKVYVSRRLSFYGLEFGGTNSLDRVYMTNDGFARGYTDEYVERMFHHEFSSILMRNYAHRFPRSEWQACNPSSFRYGGDGVQALRERKDSTSYDSRFHVRGFLCEYGTSSIEEDFNTFAEALFSGSKDFWRAVARHPNLRAKVDIAIRFYSSLDPTLNEAKFRSFAR